MDCGVTENAHELTIKAIKGLWESVGNSNYLVQKSWIKLTSMIKMQLKCIPIKIPLFPGFNAIVSKHACA